MGRRAESLAADAVDGVAGGSRVRQAALAALAYRASAKAGHGGARDGGAGGDDGAESDGGLDDDGRFGTDRRGAPTTAGGFPDYAAGGSAPTRPPPGGEGPKILRGAEVKSARFRDQEGGDT